MDGDEPRRTVLIKIQGSQPADWTIPLIDPFPPHPDLGSNNIAAIAPVCNDTTHPRPADSAFSVCSLPAKHSQLKEDEATQKWRNRTLLRVPCTLFRLKFPRG